MKDLPQILSAYTEIDAFLEDLSTPSTATTVGAYRILNDQAYFLLCWGQLEIEIDGRCRASVRRRRRDPDWQIRRAWDLYNPDDRRFSGLSMESRIRLVLDGQGGQGSPFALVMKHYGVRNEIAHGTLRSTRIDVIGFIQDCLTIQSALARAA